MVEPRAVIYCEEPRGAVLSQAEVTITGYVDPKAFNKAMNTRNKRYPVGAATSFSIREGDLMFTNPKERYRSKGSYPRLRIWSNWAGVSRDVQPMFAGIATANKKTRTDATLAYRLHGTCDIVYTGLQPVKQNDLLMWMPPAVIMEGGQIKCCAHDEKPQSERHNTGHFRASIVPIKPGQLVAKLASIRAELRALAGQPLPTVRARVQQIWNRETLFYDLKTAAVDDERAFKCPVWRFIAYVAGVDIAPVGEWFANPAGMPVYHDPRDKDGGLLKIVGDYYALVDSHCFAVANHDANKGQQLNITMRV